MSDTSFAIPVKPAAAKAPAQPADRKVRPLPLQQIGLSEHLVRSHVVTLLPGMEWEDVLAPGFFANCVDRFRVCDFVHVFSSRNDGYLELLVTAAAPSNAIRGVKGDVAFFVLRDVRFAPMELKTAAASSGMAVRYGGPSNRWLIYKLKDNTIVLDNFEDKVTAERHLATMGAPA